MSLLKKLIGKKEKTTKAVSILRCLAGLLPFSKVFLATLNNGLDNCLEHSENCSEALVLISVQKYKENCCMSRCLLRTKWIGLKSLHSLNIWEVMSSISALIQTHFSWGKWKCVCYLDGELFLLPQWLSSMSRWASLCLRIVQSPSRLAVPPCETACVWRRGDSAHLLFLLPTDDSGLFVGSLLCVRL